MGLFDLFNRKSASGAAPQGATPLNLAAKYAEAAGSTRAQTYDRQEAIAELCKLKSADAVAALLKRFTFQIDPSITDQEEKEAAFDGIVNAGREAIEPVRAFSAKAVSLSWPMRILKEILSEEELVKELLFWLSRWDTEYAKFIDPKLQILKGLEDFIHPDIREAVEPFIEDVNEEARFNAVGTILKQGDRLATASLVKLLLDEESVRVKAKVVEGFIENGWEVPDEHRSSVRKALPYQYGIDGSGFFNKRT